MKHSKMDRLDESDEYLHQTLSSHFKIILNYIETLSNLSFINQLKFDYLEGSIRTLIMKPSTSIFLISIIIILFFSHTFDFWINLLYNRFPFKIITRHFVRTGLSASHLKNVIYELKANQVGIYAIQGRRPHMEDNFSFKFDTINGECLLNGRRLENFKESNHIRHHLEMIAVYDGHGGSTASNYAQENLLNAVKKQFDALILDSNVNQCKELNVETISKILTEQILKLDSTLCTRLKNSGDIAAALICIRYVNTNELIIANIGDSRGVLCDCRGNSIALIFDHKPNTPVEFKRIYDAGGFVKFNGVWRVAGVLACSRALGDFPLKEKNFIVADPDILTFKLNDIKPKFAILASDGLFDFFSNEAAVKFVKDKMEELLSMRFSINKNELSLELAKQLTLEAFRRGSMDNITVVVWIFDYEPIKQTVDTVKPNAVVKETKVLRTKRAEEMEIMLKHQSKVENLRKKINPDNQFAREIDTIKQSVTYETEQVACDNTPVEFNVVDHLVENSFEIEKKINLHKSNDKQVSPKKKCSKLNKNIKSLNLDLSIGSKLESKADDPNKCKDDASQYDQHEAENVKPKEIDELDKNANSIYEVRLKDEYNLMRSPKKLKDQSSASKSKPDQSEEFFDC